MVLGCQMVVNTPFSSRAQGGVYNQTLRGGDCFRCLPFTFQLGNHFLHHTPTCNQLDPHYYKQLTLLVMMRVKMITSFDILLSGNCFICVHFVSIIFCNGDITLFTYLFIYVYHLIYSVFKYFFPSSYFFICCVQHIFSVIMLHVILLFFLLHRFLFVSFKHNIDEKAIKSERDMYS